MSLAVGLSVRYGLAHELFELWANATPDATAVRFLDGRLSYAELNVRANRLARYLDKSGVGREARVVVCVEPGFDIVVALLAILKLGAVYVPLDPTYPAARIQTMLDDTRPACVVTHSSLREKLPLAGLPTLDLDSAGPELALLSGENPGNTCDPEQTAYIYYTSGTTGVPKGVMASQANLASYLGTAQRRYGFKSTDVCPVLARFSFSISMFELLSPLISGGSMIMLERADVLNLPRLCETLRHVTFFHAGPSLLRSLLQYIKRHYPDFSVFAGVRHASSGGDMVPVDILEALREVFENAEVFVIYGCSEISCMGTTYAVPRGVALARSYVGKPFDGTTLRVVDDDLREVSPGVVGEVLFAGPGVVKGYLNRPELTRERFLHLDGLRFYRTGDRGRMNDQGLLELVGRSDFQVKLHGMRIELGEIEHHLRKAPGVANGIVSARDIDGGEKALVAYVVIEGSHQSDSEGRAAAIRHYLSQQLPEYMVPASYVQMSALPLNHNMKIDRRALPDPPRQAVWRASPQTRRAPETALEQRLAAIWQKVLGVGQVRPDDNFFELGGSSMLALQLIVEVDKQLGVTLTGLEVLREPFELQARICEQRSPRADERAAPGRSRAVNPTRARSATLGEESVELFHFGPERSLYGVLHGAQNGVAGTAALICAPIGHEYLRAYFVLHRLSQRLAAAGVPALRFDYYGCGDSLGKSADATCDRWQRDIVDACLELERRTNARRVTVIGVRWAASLLASVASRLRPHQVVLWDPIREPSTSYAQLLEAHRRYLRAASLFSLRRRFARTSRQELLGFGYSETMLPELAALAKATFGSCPVETLDTDSAWLDLAQLENMLPDTGISAALSQMVLRRP